MNTPAPPSRPFWHRAPKHAHHWSTEAESHQPGAHNVEFGPAKMRGTGALNAYRAQIELMERCAYGVTTVTQRCLECGEQRSYVVTGDARTPEKNALSAAPNA